MELGEKIRQARLEAGLSQRQLCGGYITRNMLSQIEHGTARPSMDTLRLLAAGLGKPVSYFLEDQAVTSPNADVMARSREAFRAGEPAQVLGTLEDYRWPDPIFDAEAGLLRALCRMALARQALEEDRLPYAAHLLERAGEDGAQTPYFTPELERKRLLLLSQAAPEKTQILEAQLPSDDEALLLRAKAALSRGDHRRAEALLEAAEQPDARWQFLRGEVCFGQGQYEAAATHFSRCQEQYPIQTAQRLEVCYRELGDFKRAYEYACKQR